MPKWGRYSVQKGWLLVGSLVFYLQIISMISTTQLNTNSINHVYDNNVHSCKAIKKKW